jgi:hypothetical protein
MLDHVVDQSSVLISHGVAIWRLDFASTFAFSLQLNLAVLNIHSPSFLRFEFNSILPWERSIVESELVPGGVSCSRSPFPPL